MRILRDKKTLTTTTAPATGRIEKTNNKKNKKKAQKKPNDKVADKVTEKVEAMQLG
ncbi:hypothetical protein ACKAV7_006199 [Fusarium commune]